MKALVKISALVLLLLMTGCVPVLPPGPPSPPGRMGTDLWHLLSALMTCVFPLFTLALLVTAVVVIVYLLRRQGLSLATLGFHSPREVAHLRYAQGEIDEEEYRRILEGIAERES